MKVERIGDKVVLTGPFEGNEHLAKIPGVVTVSEDLLRKEFPASRFLLDPKDILAAIAEHRSGTDVVTLGVSGYSSLNEKRCADLHIMPGSYEAACVSMVRKSLRALRTELNNPTIRMVYGSSDMGVDQAVENVCKKENYELLGFTCPEYLWYVKNDEKGPIICIGHDKDEYCRLYVQSLDILFAANGGPVSYEMDVLAAALYHKRVIIIDILRVLGARIQGFDKDNKVLDAAAALSERFAFIETGGLHLDERKGDPFPDICDRLVAQVLGFARQIISPERAYGTF